MSKNKTWKTIVLLAMAVVFIVGQATTILAETQDASHGSADVVSSSSVPSETSLDSSDAAAEVVIDSSTDNSGAGTSGESALESDPSQSVSSEPLLPEEEETDGLLADPDTLEKMLEEENTEDLVPDVALKEAINKELGRPETPEQAITLEDLQSLTGLTVDNDYLLVSSQPRLQSLEGIQHAVNLDRLSVSHADLSAPDALAPLSGLTNLTQLSLTDSLLKTPALDYLSGLMNLVYVDFDNNDIQNFNAFKPLFAAKLAAQLEHNAISETAYDSGVEFYYTGSTPLNDLRSLEDFVKFRIALQGSESTMSEDDRKLAIQYAVRGIGPSTYSVYFWHDLDYSTYWSSQTNIEIKLPAVVQTDLSAPLVVKENILDIYGAPALFAAPDDWKKDLEEGKLNVLHMLGMPSMLQYMEGLHNGVENAQLAEEIEDHFSLISRPSAQYPGKDEYYYEGRYFNIVPYNPYATGADDFQDPLISDYFSYTIFYYEFKHMDAPVPLPSGNGYYPSPYETNGDTTTISLAGFPLIKQEKAMAYNSGGAPLFKLDVRHPQPQAPYITGATDKVLEVGTKFDPMAGVKAFDPTQDSNSPQDITDKLTYTGRVNTDVPGTYVIEYTVTSAHNLTAKAQRTITVEAKPVFYGVEYAAGAGNATGLPSDQNKYAPNSVVTVSEKSPLRSGYEFAGWNTAANGSGKSYTGGATFKITENVTLYAQWRAVEVPSSSSSSSSSSSKPESSSTPVVSPPGPSTPPVVPPSPSRPSSSSSRPISSSSSSSSSQSSSSSNGLSGPSDNDGAGTVLPPDGFSSGGGKNGGTLDSSAGSGDAMTAEEIAAEQARLDTLNGKQTPMGSWNVQYWSFVSLLITLLMIAVSIVMALTILRDRKNDDSRKPEGWLWKLTSIAMGAVSIPLFLFTNDMSKQMVLFTRWTVVSLVLGAAQLVVLLLMLYLKKKNRDGQNWQEGLIY